MHCACGPQDKEAFNGVDFGTLRVVDDLAKPITIKNTGAPIFGTARHRTA
jgi:hypothetical protein